MTKRYFSSLIQIRDSIFFELFHSLFSVKDVLNLSSTCSDFKASFLVLNKLFPLTQKITLVSMTKDEDIHKMIFNFSIKICSLTIGETDCVFMTLITNQACQHFAQLSPYLTTLQINRSYLIDDEGISYISCLTNLKNLFLYGFETISSSGFSILSKLSQLESLKIADSNLEDTSADSFSLLTNLRSLDLQYNDRITQKTLKTLTSSLPCLEALNLSGCYSLSSASLLLHLSALSRLTALSLRACRVSDPSLAPLPLHCPALSHIDLSSCYSVTDEALCHIAGARALQTLLLRFCKVTDLGLESLSALTGLEHLDISYCESITDEGVNGLKRSKTGYGGCQRALGLAS
jgi:Leucine-rich repeat (LRR) protein